LKALQETIAQRERAETELKETHRRLVEASRLAGMAEVATNVLHNVGNVLNSVNVSSSLIADKVRNSKVVNIAKIVALMRLHENDLGNFMTNDSKGKQLPEYLANLAAHLAEEQEDVLHEVGSLVNNIIHIKEIVALQQNHAKSAGISETLKVTDLIEDALGMNRDAMTRHNIKVQRDFAEVPPILTAKHKVLQILVNLIRNAKHACEDSETPKLPSAATPFPPRSKAANAIRSASVTRAIFVTTWINSNASSSPRLLAHKCRSANWPTFLIIPARRTSAMKTASSSVSFLLTRPLMTLTVMLRPPMLALPSKFISRPVITSNGPANLNTSKMSSNGLNSSFRLHCSLFLRSFI
jgi:hypothetical protein